MLDMALSPKRTPGWAARSVLTPELEGAEFTLPKHHQELLCGWPLPQAPLTRVQLGRPRH